MRSVGCMLLMTMLVLLSGCSTAPDTPTPTLTAVPTATTLPTSTPVPTNTPQQVRVGRVTFVAEDGVTVSGTVFMGEGEKDIGVVLAHMGTRGANQRSWASFARTIAQQGYGALAFDFRADRSKLDRDVRAAVAYLRDQGYPRIVCMGASMGGTASLKVAADTDLAGVVGISCPQVTSEGLIVRQGELARLTLPKLFVTTEHDSAGVSVAGVKILYEMVPEPKAITIFPGSAHGTDIFNTPQGDEFRDLLVSFLEDLR